MKAYLGHGTDYTGEQVEVKTTEVPRGWRRADGYGPRIPTRYMVRYNNRWRRVYAICWSNAASYYIGGKGDAPYYLEGLGVILSIGYRLVLSVPYSEGQPKGGLDHDGSEEP